jgi:hypothetical protein
VRPYFLTLWGCELVCCEVLGRESVRIEVFGGVDASLEAGFELALVTRIRRVKDKQNCVYGVLELWSLARLNHSR